MSFQLPLPVCNFFLKTLERITPNHLHKILVLFIVAFVLFLFALTIGEGRWQRYHFIVDHLFTTCLIGSFCLLSVFYTVIRRPSKNQTSYYQPVQLGKIEQKFTNGEIQSIGF